MIKNLRFTQQKLMSPLWGTEPNRMREKANRLTGEAEAVHSHVRHTFQLACSLLHPDPYFQKKYFQFSQKHKFNNRQQLCLFAL